MDEEKAHYPIRMLCRVVDVSPSGYYAWRQRTASLRQRTDEELMAQIQEIWHASRETYGAPRIHAELCRKGIACSRKRVVRLMRAAGIAGVHRRRSVGTTK